MSGINKIIRIRNYRHYFENGTDSIDIAHADKKKVFVALILGDEFKTIENEDQILDVDALILKMADIIKKSKKKK